MTALQPIDRLDTHDVFNQVPPFENRNLFTGARALVDAVNSAGAGEHGARLAAIGQCCGSAEVIEWGVEANRQTPVLETYDRYGHRVDEVRFHPAYHDLMRLGLDSGFAASAWDGSARGHTLHAAILFLTGQADSGTSCPMTMTYAAVPALRADDALAKDWTPLLASRRYDPGVRALTDKVGALAGMGMTEKQGGSDVRANVTRAVPVPGADGTYTLHGHKWFTSAPMNDVFLVLAQTEGGVTCFVVPRVLADGTRNQLDVVRLKDKLGNRSNASSELEFDGTVAHRLGDEGRGVRTIIEMVAATRLDCVLGSSSLMRRAVSEASWHVTHRSAFGSRLVDKPLMQNVIADLHVETEAATALAMRLAAEHERALRRIALPLAKFWVCKRTPFMVAEALECLGGNGYVEESGMPLLYREAPLNSVWEGSGNVNALDVLRALGREPEVLDAWITEVGRARGGDARLDRAIEDTLAMIGALMGEPDQLERQARRLAGRMAAVLQGSLLVRHAPAEVADIFCASRLGPSAEGVFGALDGGDLGAVVTRTTPTV